MSIEESVRQVQADLAALLEHEHASLALAQRCSGVAPGVPLFNAVLNCRNHIGQSSETSGIAGITFLNGQQRNSYPFSMNVDDLGSDLSLTSHVAHAIGAQKICGYMQESLKSLVDALDRTPNIQVRDLEIISVDERDILLRSWNTTEASIPDYLFIHQMFESQADKSPDAIALVFEDQEMTYRELNERANSLAHHLIDLGVKPDSFVAICVSRSIAMIIGLLAVLKAGGAYVPLDPTFASERLRDNLVDASPSILLADNSGIEALQSSALQSIKIVDPNMLLEVTSSNPVVPDLRPHHLAYMIYTSGSTGKPKGVMIEHRGVTNLAMSRPSVWGVNSSSKVLQFISFSFDGSVHEMWSALCFGGSLHVVSDRVRRDQSQLWSYLETHTITQATLTPTVLQDHKSLPPLNSPLNLMLAGEAVSSTLIKALRVLIPNGSIINEYGPTETTVAAIGWKCPDDFTGEVAPIGKPYPNKRVYVLDSYRKLVPVGAIGELYIAGTGVARGYLNRPDLTEETFLQDIFVADGKSRMYKTGDLARYLPDGNLMFLGRRDHQVKIRGFRIELGEIEARLSELSIVREAVVLALDEGTSKRLVAYIVSEPMEGLAHILREHISSKLPDYMIPAAFVRLDVLPLTPNGKLDRHALPEPDIDAFVSQEYEAPQGEVESSLATIWSELLKVDRIGRHDNFFMLGGHSLIAVQMIERLRRVGMEISVRTLFDTPTLSALAQSLNKSHVTAEAPENLITRNTTRITPELLPLIDLTQDDIDLIVDRVEGGISNIQDIYALSPTQDGILFHHIMATKGDPYVVVIMMSFDNKDILDRYLGAFQTLIDRHDILRTGIVWEDISTPAQVVLRHAALPITELSLDPMNGSIVEQLKHLTDPREHRINLSQAPITRFVIAQDIDGRWIAVQLSHHMVGDHSTLEVMGAEIQTIMNDQEHMLLKPQPFRNLIAQVKSGPCAEVHEQFFTKMLLEIDTPALPFGYSAIHHDILEVTESYLTLPQDLNDRLRGHAKKMGVSLASLCHVAWAQVVSRTSGQERVVFGTILFGRMQSGSGSDRAMGLFINTLPLRIDVGGASVEESVRQTQANLAALLEHEHASLVLAQRCSSVQPGTPLFNSILNYRHNATESTEAPGPDGLNTLYAQERTTYPFAISVEDGGNTLGLTAQVVKQFDSSRICEYMQQALQSLSEALEHAPNMHVRDLEILPYEEREMLIRSWNTVETMHAGSTLVHQLFESQAKEFSDAIAVVCEDQEISYHELNARSNSLAHHLIDLGVKPDTLVAICVRRSIAMIIGLLAVLKAGGAYVPLDPMFASERLHEILADASPSVVLADNSGVEALGSSILLSMKVVDPNILLKESVVNPEVHGVMPNHLAYVIYTSGSTGKPKGVMIEHQGVTNLAMSRPLVSGISSSSKVLQFFSFSFDGSVHDIWSALCFGGSLHVLADHVRQDTSLLWAYLEEHSITHALLTPAVLQDCKNLVPLRTPLKITLGGEALSPALLRSLRVLIPNGSIANDYGPTEATVDAISWKCPDDFGDDMVPIGRPNPNKRIYVLDSYRRPAPIGAVGELYIAGSGIARGYLNRPDLTEMAFLPDVFAADGESRMYKTGDLVRYLPDGNLMFLGRNDYQVKIRGFRIELGEIEARLAEHSIVREAVVLALDEGASRRLVAYVVSEPREGLAHSLREHISSKLPEYMIPAAFVRLDALPLTPNGKLDRRALPEPDIDAFVSQGYEAPQGEIECTLAMIWSELLKVDRVGRHDNFFMLGGHSLLAVKLAGYVGSRLGLHLKLQTLFEAPTIAELTQHILQDRVDKQEGAFDVLLALKSQGNRPPLFCIHPIFGLGWSFARLSRHLHSEQPLYALQSRGINGNGKLASSIMEMVWDYIDQILQVQPRGPYNLLGWSFGGSIAHSIAVQLENLGEKVTLLALMDSTPDYSMISDDTEVDQEDFYSKHLARFNDNSTTEEGREMLERVQDVYRNNIELTKQFSPSVYTGDMTFFSATGSSLVIDPLIWSQFTLGKIKVHQVECGHLEMDKPGSMSKIGAVLATELEESYQQWRLDG
ncbi:hypothetical protein BGX26_000500 [Mortierella sp. AD094]|nr:hypothetical protein BGX26_000500 [Mortierella sp. AD094]